MLAAAEHETLESEPCLRTLCDDSWTEDDLQTRFYGLGLGLDLVTCGRCSAFPYGLRVGQARPKSNIQRNHVRPAAA